MDGWIDMCKYFDNIRVQRTRESERTEMFQLGRARAHKTCGLGDNRRQRRQRQQQRRYSPNKGSLYRRWMVVLSNIILWLLLFYSLAAVVVVVVFSFLFSLMSAVHFSVRKKECFMCLCTILIVVISGLWLLNFITHTKYCESHTQYV